MIYSSRTPFHERHYAYCIDTAHMSLSMSCCLPFGKEFALIFGSHYTGGSC